MWTVVVTDVLVHVADFEFFGIKTFNIAVVVVITSIF